MTITQRALLVLTGLVALGVVGLGMVGVVNPVVGLGVLAALVALSTWRVPRFWWTVLFSAMGGIAAGLVILGPGLRIVMRVVAIVDPLKTPEFTIEGTLFLIVIIGGLLGGVLAIGTGLVVRGLGIRGRLIPTLILGTLVMGVIFTAPDLRQELFDFGLGAWMNIPMFSAVSLGYGYAATRVTQRLERKAGKPSDTSLIEVPA